MRPDDRRPPSDPIDPPLDADLEALDRELDAAGAQARRTFHGRTQPTNVFAADLRQRLVGSTTAAGSVPPDGLTEAATSTRVTPISHLSGGSRIRPGLAAAGGTWAPTRLAPRVERRTPTILPRARWAVLAAAVMATALVAGAIGARPDWLFPPPVPTATPPSMVDANATPPSEPTSAPTPPSPSAGPTDP
jgi:hypothetical protein